MKNARLVLGVLAMVFVLGLFGCVTIPDQRNEPPITNDPRTKDVKLISAYYVGEWILINDGNEAQWVITGWRIRVQNIGTQPVSHIKFRLKIMKKEDNQMMYSQVHTIAIQLNPQDVLTSQSFALKEKFWYADKNIFLDNKFWWDAEIIQVW
ncbi:MAG: hypothetical protein Q8O03_07435 [Nanoarchaeota archaeon]|nr:hypothetical protein [Nanoarchaeota archaeon]